MSRKPKKPPGTRGPKSDAAVVAEVIDVALEAESLHFDNLRRERLLLDKRDELVAMLPDAEAQKALVVLNGHIKQQQGINSTRMLVFARIRPPAAVGAGKTSASMLGLPAAPALPEGKPK
jgi:hypothetical protein